MKSLLASVFLFAALGGFRLLAGSAVFAYEDFGPQSATYGLLGNEWYQWDSHGSDDPNEKYHVKVVVYWQESLEAIKTQYPVDQRRNSDFRHIRYDAARKHLQKLIPELEAWDIDAGRLRKTLRRLDKLNVGPDRPAKSTTRPGL